MGLNLINSSFVRIVFAVLSFSLMAAFICYFIDVKAVLSLKGLFAFLIYSSLSIITGLRYFNLLVALTGRRPEWLSVVRIPATMNLAGLIFPIKGGGLWLIFYLKRFHRISLTQNLFLALLNALLAICIIISLAVIWLADTNFSLFLLAGIFLPTYIISALTLYIIAVRTKIYIVPRSPKVLLIDILLSLLHMAVFFSLPSVIFPDQPPQVYMGLFALIITSSLIKLTPGNVGIFEGLSLVLAGIFPVNGYLFPEFVALFRLFSLIHASLVGVPSIFSLFSFAQIRAITIGNVRMILQ